MENIARLAPSGTEACAKPVDASPATVQQTRRKCTRQGSDAPINAISKTAAGPTEEELVQQQWNEALLRGCRDAPLTVEQQKRFDNAVAERTASSIAFNQRKLNPAVKGTAAFACLGGIDAACSQLLRGFEVGPLNHAKLFNTDPAKVAINLVNRIVYEDDERGRVGENKRRSPRLPGTLFGAELERFFRYVLKHSTKAVFSFSGRQPDEPWIAGFCDSVVSSKQVPTVALTITKIAETCLQSVDQQKVAEVQHKSEARLKHKTAHNSEAAQRHGFGAHPVPQDGGTVACEAGYDSGDFDEHGELLPDSDCEDEGCEWNYKRARYCKLMEQKGPGMDLKGRSPAETSGAKLVVHFDEDKGTVPYEAVVLDISAGERHRLQHEIGADFMWVRFSNGDELPVTDDDTWDWQDRVRQLKPLCLEPRHA